MASEQELEHEQELDGQRGRRDRGRAGAGGVGGEDGLGAGRWTWAEGNHVCASAVVLGTEVANKRVILTLALLRNLQRLVAESCGQRSSSSECVSSKQITSIALICRSLLGRSRHSAFVLRIMLKASHRAFTSNQPSMRVIHIPLHRVSQWVAPKTQGDQVEQQTWRGVASSRTDGPYVPVRCVLRYWGQHSMS